MVNTLQRRGLTDARVFIILTSLFCSLGLGLAIKYKTPPLQSIPSDIVRVNATVLCTLFEQYRLSGNVRITVCDHVHEGLRVDIRQFLNNKPTIKGIALSKSSFESLSNFWPNITATVLDHNG